MEVDLAHLGIHRIPDLAVFAVIARDKLPNHKLDFALSALHVVRVFALPFIRQHLVLRDDDDDVIQPHSSHVIDCTYLSTRFRCAVSGGTISCQLGVFQPSTLLSQSRPMPR
jgi:hypothetical protein